MADKESENRCAIDTDLATAVDGLGFAPYKETLAEVIRYGRTPLTIGVFGAWGSGKTSLLKMLEKCLKEYKETPETRIVWFNAWQYGEQTALWRALLFQMLEALRPKPRDGTGNTGKGGEPAKDEAEEIRKLNQKLDDLQASLYRVVQREESGGFEVDWTRLAKGTLKGAVKLGLPFIPGGQLIKQLKEFVDPGAASSIDELLGAFQRAQSTVRIEQVRFLEQFRREFEQLVLDYVVDEKQKEKRRLVLFIDDLDRCLPEKAIEVLEAIKLFLDVEGCVVVIAVDRKVIVEGIRVRYRDFVLARGSGEPPPISGEDFLEKIIQVPFNLPPVRREHIKKFIEGQTCDLTPECAEVFCLGIEANPRKIKRGLNVFWMHERLAGRRSELKDVIKPVRLAKVVVIQEIYPKLYADWVEAPLLLRHLEEYFVAEERRRLEPPGEREKARPAGPEESFKPRGPQSLVEKWSGRRPLRRMLLFKAGEEDAGFGGMDQREFEEYIYLTRTSAVSVGESDIVVDGDLWQALLSKDLTRVESAVGGILEKERFDYARRLMAMVESDGRQAATDRASAGMALGFLGDPRPGVGLNADGLPDIVWCDIEPGPFTMGSEDYDNEKPKFECNLIKEPYRMAKYPVTNGQFATFVEDGGYTERWRRCWTDAGWEWKGNRSEPEKYGGAFGLVNHPVVGVSWFEAVAFCNRCSPF
jgi:Cdc6-like AAA superfamily ATPase